MPLILGIYRIVRTSRVCTKRSSTRFRVQRFGCVLALWLSEVLGNRGFCQKSVSCGLCCKVLKSKCQIKATGMLSGESDEKDFNAPGHLMGPPVVRPRPSVVPINWVAGPRIRTRVSEA